MKPDVYKIAASASVAITSNFTRGKNYDEIYEIIKSASENIEVMVRRDQMNLDDAMWAAKVADNLRLGIR